MPRIGLNAKPVFEQRQLHKGVPARLQNPGELREVRENGGTRGQVLQDEIADEHVRDRVVDPVEPFARDCSELDSLVRDGDARALEHRRRDVDGQDAVEPLRERSRHAPRAATDLDAPPASRIRAEPVEETF